MDTTEHPEAGTMLTHRTPTTLSMTVDILIEQYQDGICYRTFKNHCDRRNLDSKLSTIIRAYNMYHTVVSYLDASGDLVSITSNDSLIGGK